MDSLTWEIMINDVSSALFYYQDNEADMVRTREIWTIKNSLKKIKRMVGVSISIALMSGGPGSRPLHLTRYHHLTWEVLGDRLRRR